jgi:hypothetical protein
MELSTFSEDLISNAILGAVLAALVLARDVCKRISHSNCKYGEHGLEWSLPTWHGGDPPGEGDPPDEENENQFIV